MMLWCYDALVRTTLDLDDDVLRAAREIARFKNQALGRTVSDLARRGLQPAHSPTIEIREGIPALIHGPDMVPVTSELVKNLADDE